MTEAKTFRTSVRGITITAIFMALVIALSSFGIPVPGGHLYFNDVVICLASLLLGDPLLAFVVGGIGAFLGDFFFYPAPMFVSLVTHGIQAIAIALISRHILKKNPVAASGIAVTVGAILMVAGYTVGRAFVYATPETALIKLPFQIFQAAFGAVTSMLLCYPAGLKKRFAQSLNGMEDLSKIF